MNEDKKYPKDKEVKPVNDIMKDIIERVRKDKGDNHRTATGYSRMHHRHSRT